MKQKNAAIDILKLYFACMIVLFHGSQNLGSGVKTFTSGRIGVEFFFIVSGFLMASSALRYTERLAAAPLEGEKKPSVWKLTQEYILHKLGRLSPNVFIAWFIAAAVVITAEQYRGFELAKQLSSGIFEFFLIKAVGYSDIFAPNGVTWYLSGMLLAMALLFPLLVAKRDCFLHWFAPLAANLLYGYMNVAWTNGLTGSAGWSGLTTKGMYRAIAGLCLGCTVYSLAQRLRSLRPGWLLRLLSAVFGLLCLAFLSYVAWKKKSSNFDYVLVFLAALVVLIAFGEIGLTPWLSRSRWISRIAGFFGELSMNLFLSNGYWSHYLPHFLPGWEGKRLYLAYLAVCMANALLLMLISGLLRRAWPAIRKGLGRLAGAAE